MKVMGLCKRVIGNLRESVQIKSAERQIFATKPDILEIPKAPNTEKMTEIMADAITHLDKKTVKKMDKSSIEDFFEQAQKLIIDSYKIPYELSAPITVLNDMNKKMAMGYSIALNHIFVNSNILKRPRYEIFSALKHEYGHQKQNYQILCTEGLGETAVQKYATVQADLSVREFIRRFYNIPKEQLESLKPQLGESYNRIIELQKAAKESEEAVHKLASELKENEYQILIRDLTNLRQKVIKEYGIIPADSEKAKVSKKYFDDFINNITNPTQLQSILSSTELEAYTIQGLSTWEYLLHKFI